MSQEKKTHFLEIAVALWVLPPLNIETPDVTI